MRSSTVRLAAALSVSLLMLVGSASADEQSLKIDQVPKPVMAAVKARFKDAEVTGAGKETENDKVVYEVTIKVKGQKIDVSSTPEGEIFSIEKEIAAKSLPKVVAGALEKKYAKATYKIVEEIIEVSKKKETLAFYEVLLVTADKKTIEVKLTPEGKIDAEENKTSDKD